MNLRWLLFDYVDPNLKLTRQERRLIRARAWDLQLQSQGMPQTLKDVQERDAGDSGTSLSKFKLMLLAMLPGLVPSVPLFAYIVVQPRTTVLSIVSMFGAMIILSWLTAASVGRILWRTWVIQALRRSGHDVCLRCGYYLHGLREASTRCPECGRLRETASG